MSADAVTGPRESDVMTIRGILVLVVVLDSYLLASLQVPGGDWREWWAAITIATVLVGNVFVFLAIRRAVRAAFVVQCIVGTYGTFVAARVLWYLTAIPSEGMHPALTISYLITGVFALGQVLVAALLWRMRRRPAVR